MNSYKILLLIIVIATIALLFVYGRNLANTNSITIGSFQKITAIVTCIILLVILIFIWGTLTYAKKGVPAGPIVPQCPDFWEIKETATGPKCVNVKEIGTCLAAAGDEYMTMDFNSANFTDNCAKYTWANNCNVAWDGLTYGVANPCLKPAVPTVAKASTSAVAAAAAPAVPVPAAPPAANAIA